MKYNAYADIPRETLQLVVGIAQDWMATTIALQRYERDDADSEWRAVGALWKANIGKNGLTAEKTEGDGKAPAGMFAIGKTYALPPLPSGAVPITPTMFCIDDARSRYYNRIIDTSTIADADWSSHEEMTRADELYDRVVAIGYNPDDTPGRGSCIFFHVARGPGMPTEGCTSLPRECMDELIAWLRPERHPMYMLTIADFPLQ